ncbi:MAG: pyridoxamine 5'-phosphate oxidase family protein [Phycisphaerales bacterium]|nr:pyridoxamine 5'-phosphate oxidase family protein [Phycisphaerales bacterium]
MIEMSRAEIDLLLNNARVGRICMADSSGKPYIVPMPFYWNGQTVYIRLALSGRKGEVLQQNDQVCFEADDYSDNFDQYASVLIEGRLVPVDDIEEKIRIKELNSAKYNRLRQGYRPGHGRSKPISELPMRKIEVAQISGRRKEESESQQAAPVAHPAANRQGQPA